MWFPLFISPLRSPTFPPVNATTIWCASLWLACFFSFGQPGAGAPTAMRLLIVEDNPTIRRMIKTIVGALADEVYECDDGAAALAVYQTQRPDVVLMDIALGLVDGITATRQITTADPDAYVIIVTSYDETDLREAAQQAGACGYVLKENLTDLRQLFTANHQACCGQVKEKK